MQVGFNRTQWEMANNARLPGFDKFQGADSLTSVPKNATFPESPFISNQPLRYNVQLNRQLTAVQRAEKYLYTTELQVAQLQRVLQQEGHNNEIKSTALKTLHWLQQRVSVSGNTIDRQLNFVADQRTEVNFNLHQVDKLLQPAESETLLFSLAGAEHRIVAVKLSADASATQNLLRLNNGLGRFGLHGAVDSHGNVQFRVDEQSWADIHADLQVRGGGGIRFSQETFQSMKLQPERVLEDRVRDIAEHPLTANKHRVGIQQAMDHITEQMSKLSEHKRNINLQINSMSSFPVPHSAQMAAEVLASKLAQGQYAMWANILVVQGSGRNSMVRNLLES